MFQISLFEMDLIGPNIISLHFFDILLPKTMDLFVETLDQNYLSFASFGLLFQNQINNFRITFFSL